MRGDRGGALVEFSLALPVLASFLLGITTSGMLFNSKMQMTAAVREGARYGATLPVDQTFLSGNWATNVRALAIDRSGRELTTTQVCIALVSGANPVPVSAAFTTKSDGSACYDDSSVGDPTRRVQVSATKSGRIEAVFWTQRVTVNVRATAKHEENV